MARIIRQPLFVPLSPHLLSQKAPHDVASNTRQALFVGKMKDAVGDMAKGFAAQDGKEQEAARAGDIVIMSKPVRQSTLFECLTQLHEDVGGLLGTALNRR
jgi:hypothetical protein